MKSKIERVDDIPLLIAEFEKSGLNELLNQHFPDHGNWQGVNGGKVAVGFLTYILSCSNHTISHVETWASERILTLGHCLDESELTCKDFTDDKLTNLLERFSDETAWAAFEHAHNQRLINVYQLGVKEEPIRLDAMITQSHRAASGEFQYGHSKQHRSDLPQLKTMVATLDPLAMPLFSKTVPGNTSDDVLYLPVLKELIGNLNLLHQLFVGDCKMGSMEVRSFLQHKSQYYLLPLSKKQCSQTQLAAYLANRPSECVEMLTEDKQGQPWLKAKGFEQMEQIHDEQNNRTWEERRIIVYSPTYAKTQKLAFENRLINAKTDLELLLQAKQGRKKLKTYEEVHSAVQQILNKHKVKGFMQVNIEQREETKTIRAYGNRPERIEAKLHFQLQIQVDETLKAQHLQNLGWRAYACNAPKERLSTQQAILCYRNEYRIEHKFDELLNRVTALMPVFLHKENRIKALIRLLLLALKYVSVIQYQVRSELKATKQKIKELIPGNPGRATDKPTTSLILKAFNNIHLNIVSVENKIHVNISDLKPVQLKLLELLKIPPEIYRGFNQLSFSRFDFSEM